MKYKIVFLITAICLAFSCRKSVSFDEIIGTYHANHGFGNEMLVLKNDKTYVYSIMLDEKTVFKNTGKWDYVENSGLNIGQITFWDYISKWQSLSPDEPQKDKGNASYTWTTNVERMLSAPSIIINSDLGYYFYKDRIKSQ